MLSFEKETRIHQMLDDGVPQLEIASAEGVSSRTIWRIADARAESDSMNPTTKAEIYTLCMARLSPASISKRLGLPESLIRKIRRASLLHVRRISGPEECPLCGAAILPKVDAVHTPPESPKYIKQVDAQELFKLTDDVIGLATEHIVPNYLFYEIAKRCETTINKITGGTNGEEED